MAVLEKLYGEQEDNTTVINDVPNLICSEKAASNKESCDTDVNWLNSEYKYPNYETQQWMSFCDDEAIKKIDEGTNQIECFTKLLCYRGVLFDFSRHVDTVYIRDFALEKNVIRLRLNTIHIYISLCQEKYYVRHRLLAKMYGCLCCPCSFCWWHEDVLCSMAYRHRHVGVDCVLSLSLMSLHYDYFMDIYLGRNPEDFMNHQSRIPSQQTIVKEHKKWVRFEGEPEINRERTGRSKKVAGIRFGGDQNQSRNGSGGGSNVVIPPLHPDGQTSEEAQWCPSVQSKLVAIVKFCLFFKCVFASIHFGCGQKVNRTATAVLLIALVSVCSAHSDIRCGEKKSSIADGNSDVWLNSVRLCDKTFRKCSLAYSASDSCIFWRNQGCSNTFSVKELGKSTNTAVDSPAMKTKSFKVQNIVPESSVSKIIGSLLLAHATLTVFSLLFIAALLISKCICCSPFSQPLLWILLTLSDVLMIMNMNTAFWKRFGSLIQFLIVKLNNLLKGEMVGGKYLKKSTDIILKKVGANDKIDNIEVDYVTLDTSGVQVSDNKKLFTRKRKSIWNEVIKWNRSRRIKRNKGAIDMITGNSEPSEDTCDSSAMFRKIQYGAKSQTPHEVDVNENMNIVSLRSKQPIPHTLIEFMIDFCNLTKQKIMKTARHLSIQDIGNINKNTTDLKEIELSGLEVTDSIHRDSKAEDNTLVNSTVENLPAATANNRLMKNITIAEELKPLVFPQIAFERQLEVPVVTPKSSGRTDILKGEQKKKISNEYTAFQPLLDMKARRLLQDTQLKLISNDNYGIFQNSQSDVKSPEEQFKDLKYKVVTSLSYKKEKEVDRRYSKPIELINKLWPAPFDETGEIIRRFTEIPQPQIDIKYTREILQVSFVFEPLMTIVDQIALGRPPAPHVSMRYELLRFCTLRSYPKEDKPYLIKLAEAGFYYASDGDGVVCYCCGIRRYNWTADDQPMKIHKRINPTCKFLIKNEEVNVRNNYNGPLRKNLLAIDSIPEPVESQEPSEDINNDWAPERTHSPAPRSQNNESMGSSNQLGINTAIPKHSQYATKTQRLASFNGWPDTASHTPDVLADAGFFYAGFADCVRCFYCGIGLRHWTQDDNPWIEHARWAKNCVFVKQKKGEEFVNLVQLAVQYSQDNASEDNSGANQLSPQEIENILLSDAAQSVLDMGYQPRIIKTAIEQIIRQNHQAKITAQFLMEKILEIEEGSNETPGTHVSTGAATSTVGATGTNEGATNSSLKESLKQSAEPEKKQKGGKSEDKKGTSKEKNDEEIVITKANNDVSKYKAPYDPESQQDPQAIKAENEQLKEQTLCKICLDQTVSIVFLPCGHLVTCADCAPAMRKCPICRALVKGTVRTYMS